MNDLDEILGKQVSEQRKVEVEDYFYGLLKPTIFWGKDGFTIRHNKDFEEACAIISHKYSRNPKEMTVIEFYQSLDTLKKQSKNV